MKQGNWMPAHVRAAASGWPRFSLTRLQISFDGGENQRTFWVLLLAGFAFSFALPAWFVNRFLAGANSSGPSRPTGDVGGIDLRAAHSAHERLVTIVDEAFGLRPVQESTEELLATLERLLFEDRLKHSAALTRAETAERELVAERRNAQEAIDAIRKLGRDGALDSILPGTYGAEVTGDD